MRIPFIDSHTGGEPTRLIPEGSVELRGATMAERRNDLLTRLDRLRNAIACEPRGTDILVGAWLTPPVSEGAIAGVVYFDNVGVIGMCGHGTIGVVETLRHLGRISPGPLKLDTAVGTVEAILHPNGDAEIHNVLSRRYRSSVTIDVAGVGEVTGDVAYGGNWFFIARSPSFDISLAREPELTALTWRIRRTLEREGITGEGGGTHPPLIDHIVLRGESPTGADSKNFVLCPGGAYDRSPCGTGTSATMACLAASGELQPGDWYVQESVTGSRFRARYETAEGGILPTIVGRAFVTAEGSLVFDSEDNLSSGMTT